MVEKLKIILGEGKIILVFTACFKDEVTLSYFNIRTQLFEAHAETSHGRMNCTQGALSRIVQFINYTHDINLLLVKELFLYVNEVRVVNL